MTMKWNVGTKIGAGFSVAVVIFLIVGAVSYQSTIQLVSASDLRRQTYVVLSELNDVMSLMQDIQIGQRGYALTGEESYLAPYQAALGNIDARMQEVRNLTKDNPRHQRRLDALELLIKDRLAFAKETVDAIRTKGPEAGVQLIRTGKGNNLMMEIRKVLDEIESEENELLQQRTNELSTGLRPSHVVMKRGRVSRGTGTEVGCALVRQARKLV